MPYVFNEARLVREIDRLPVQLRVAFAAACAERLLPSYVLFSERTGGGDPAGLRRILTRLWDDLTGTPMTKEELQSSLGACMAMIPREDDGPWVMEQAAAEDAGAAAAYALRCRHNGSGQEACWAARRAYEALDHRVLNSTNIDVNQPGAEAQVLAHPLVQAELDHQRRDLDELLGASCDDMQQIIGRVRDRARTAMK